MKKFAILFFVVISFLSIINAARLIYENYSLNKRFSEKLSQGAQFDELLIQKVKAMDIKIKAQSQFVCEENCKDRDPTLAVRNWVTTSSSSLPMMLDSAPEVPKDTVIPVKAVVNKKPKLDLAKPKVEAVTSKGEIKLALRLESIFFNPNTNQFMASISQEGTSFMVSMGDEIFGYRVISLDESKIVLDNKTNKLVLKITN